MQGKGDIENFLRKRLDNLENSFQDDWSVFEQKLEKALYLQDVADNFANRLRKNEAQVEKLIVATDEDGAKVCKGAKVRRAGSVVDVEARKELILSAGAIGSPTILQLSGIGPAQHLKETGIDVVADLPGVGENLQDHYLARLCFKAKDIGTFNERSRGWRLGVELLRYATTRTGLLTAAPGNVSASIKVMPGVEKDDVGIGQERDGQSPGS